MKLLVHVNILLAVVVVIFASNQEIKHEVLKSPSRLLLETQRRSIYIPSNEAQLLRDKMKKACCIDIEDFISYKTPRKFDLTCVFWYIEFRM